VFASLDEALAAAAGEDEVFVIGGAALYAEAMPRADRLYLTRVHATVEGDVTFPGLDPAAWTLVSEDRREADARHDHAFSFRVYERGGRRSAG
jgi:dihydrofolate reductase